MKDNTRKGDIVPFDLLASLIETSLRSFVFLTYLDLEIQVDAVTERYHNILFSLSSGSISLVITQMHGKQIYEEFLATMPLAHLVEVELAPSEMLVQVNLFNGMQLYIRYRNQSFGQLFMKCLEHFDSDLSALVKVRATALGQAPAHSPRTLLPRSTEAQLHGVPIYRSAKNTPELGEDYELLNLRRDSHLQQEPMQSFLGPQEKLQEKRRRRKSTSEYLRQRSLTTSAAKLLSAKRRSLPERHVHVPVQDASTPQRETLFERCDSSVAPQLSVLELNQSADSLRKLLAQIHEREEGHIVV